MKKLITFKTDKSGLTIRIPRTLLNHVAKNHPEMPVKIIDSYEFLKEFSFQLENTADSNSTESGLSDFEYLIDKAIEACVENGSDSIELIDIEQL